MMMDRIVPGGVDGRPDARGGGPASAACWRGSRRRGPRLRASTIPCPRCRTAPSPPASCAPELVQPVRRRRLSSAAPPAAPSMPARIVRLRALRPAGLRSQGAHQRRRRCAACWCGWTRSARASGSSSQLLGRLTAGRIRAAGRPARRRRRSGAGRGIPRRRVRERAAGGGRPLARVHARDASWFQWPLLEAAIEGNIVADFPLCNKSFNCSYSGHDL